MHLIQLQPLWTDLRFALLQGTPPLYWQLLVATAIFVFIRLWIWWRNRRVRRVLVNPQIFTGLWLGAMVLLSMGLLEQARHFSDLYLRRILLVLSTLIA